MRRIHPTHPYDAGGDTIGGKKVVERRGEREMQGKREVRGCGGWYRNSQIGAACSREVVATCDVEVVLACVRQLVELFLARRSSV